MRLPRLSRSDRRPLTSRLGVRWACTATRVAAAAVAASRLAKAASAADPIHSATTTATSASATTPTISVVIPARDEAGRIGPLLDAIIAAPGVREVIVVDDQSSDETAAIARAAGATVVDGLPLPPGWAGKAWALQQGIEHAVTDWVVTLDADARPDPRLPSAIVGRAVDDGFDFLTAGGRFECPTAPSRWLHAAMLTTLVYRFGPPGTTTTPARTMANGQCMALRRADFIDAHAMSPVKGDVVEDIALARHLANTGWSVGFLDATDLLTVRMFESIHEVWDGWGRSIALPGVEPFTRQVLDLGVVVLAQALPLPRLILRRSDLLDLGLVALRLGTLGGTRTAYDRADVAYWLSPLADVPAAVAIARGITRRGRQTWRGRTYG